MKGGETMNKKISTAMVTVVLGLIIGLGSTVAFRNGSTVDAQSTNTSMTAKAINLRVLLNSLNREHMNLASNVLRNGYDGNMDFDSSFQSLDKNSNDLAKSIGTAYGQDAQNRFLEIWRSHINYFKDYTVAMKQGDQAGMDKAVAGLADYVNNISDFLSKANPNLPRATVHQVVSDHVAYLKSVIDAHAQGDDDKSYAQQRAGDNQIGTKVADAVAGAIVKQKPQMFK